MSRVYKNNFEIIEQRWPELASILKQKEIRQNQIDEVRDAGLLKTLMVDGIHLTSAYDRSKEAIVQLQILPKDPTHIHIYGMSLGDLLIASLNNYSCSVSVHLVNLYLFDKILSYIDLAEILADLRVNIRYAGNDKAVFLPFVVSPACLQLADKACWKVRDELQIRLASEYISERYNLHRDIWLQQISDNYQNINNDHDVAELFMTNKGGMAVVIAAGPSLDMLYVKIRDLQHQGAVIVAVDATISPLLKNKIKPDYVVTIDGQRDLLLRFYQSSVLNELANSNLVYLPVVHHDVLERWQGERYCAYSSLGIYSQVSTDLPRGELFVSGTVTHPAVDLAVQMGSEKIYFAGLDFGYPRNRSHATGSYYEQDVKQQGHEKNIENGYGENILSIQNLIVYLRDLENYIRQHPNVDFYNLSKEGAFIEGARYNDE